MSFSLSFFWPASRLVRLRSAFGLTMLTLLTWTAVGCGHNDTPIPAPDAAAVDAAVDDDAVVASDDMESAPDEAEPQLPVSVCPVYDRVQVSHAAGDSSQPAIIWDGTHYVVVWADGRQSAGDIFGSVLTETGAPTTVAETLLAHTANQLTSPEIAPLPAAGTGYVVVYEECVGPTATGSCTGGSGVGSVLLSAAGAVAAPVKSLAPLASVQRRPYLATGHDKIYVTYRDSITGSEPSSTADAGGNDAGGTLDGGTPSAVPGAPRTVARLTTLDGTGALTGPGIVVPQVGTGEYPFVAISPTQVALTYLHDANTPDIVLDLFDPNLALQKEVLVRTNFSQDATNPVVQWNSTRWVIAWEDQRNFDEGQIFATTVTADGNVQAAQPAYPDNGNWPTIASGAGMTSLIGFYGFPGRHVLLARMQADGTLKPGQVVLDTGTFPAVAYNGKLDEYAVVYQDDASHEVFFSRFKCAPDESDAGAP